MSDVKTRMKVLRGLGVLLLICVAVIVGIATWLLKTESGLRFALNRAPELIAVEQIDGTISDLSFSNLSVTLDGALIKIKSGKLKWTIPDLLSKLVSIDSLTLENVKIELSPPQKNQENLPYMPWQGIELPIDISLKNALINQLLVSSDGAEVVGLKQVSTQLTVSNNILQIQDFSLELANSDSPNPATTDADASNSVQLDGIIDLSAKPNGTVKLNNVVQWLVADQAINVQGSIDGNWRSMALVQRAENPCACELTLALKDLLGEEISWGGTLKISENQIPATNNYGLDIDQGEFKLSGSVAPGAGLTGLVAEVSGSISGNTPALPAWSLATDIKYRDDTLNVKQLEISEQRRPSAKPVTAPPAKNQQTVTSGQLNISGAISGLSQFINGSNDANAKADLSGHWQDLGWPLNQTSKHVNTRGNFKLLGVPENFNITASASGISYEKPVAAKINIQVVEQTANIETLALSAGASRVSLVGKLGEQVALDWDLSSPELSELLPNAAGDLVSQGRISGAARAPRVKATAQARRIDYGDISLEKLNLAADGVLGETLEAVNVNATLGRLSKDTFELARDFRATVDGTGKNHTLGVTAMLFGQSSFALSASGGMTNTGWRGNLTQLSLGDPSYDAWRLAQAVEIRSEGARFTTERTCVGNQNQEVCIALNSDSNGLAANGKISDVELHNLNPLLALYDISLAGKLAGEFEYNKEAATSTAEIRAQFTANNSTLDVNKGGDNQQSLAILTTEITLSQRQTLNSKVLITLENDDRVSAELAVAAALGSPDFTHSKLDGRIIAQLNDLSTFQAIALPLNKLKGSLDADISLDGTINTPTVGMRTRLQDAQIEIPDLGLRLSEIQLNATSVGKQNIEIEGSLKSGQGNLEVGGDLNFSQLNQPRFSLSLKGKNVELMKTPEVYVDGNVDTQIIITNDLIELSGNVALVQADLDFQLPENAVLASEDVVLLGEEQLKKSVEQKINLTLDLGAQTKIRAQGLDAFLVGGLELLQEPGGIMRANGQIDVKEGRYAAYNQKLKIDKGQLVFNGGAVDDPNLLLRAQKTVDSTTAGVSVTGRASAPILQLYSTPSMSDQDVLSVLVFDKRIDELGSQDGLTLLKIANSLRGDGTRKSRVDALTENIQESLGLSNLELQLTGNSPSLVAGKQLSSKFYIGYGYGLLDAAQSLVLRYKINQAWSIQGDVGVDSGADIRYQIER